MGKIWLVRHGITSFNIIQKYLQALDEYTPASLVNFDTQYRDPLLSKEGIQQALRLKPLINSLDIHSVIVSPLRRALHTAHIIFGSHPNSPQVTVYPILHEKINTWYDVSRYEGKPLDPFSHFDWSLIPNNGVHLVRLVLENNFNESLEAMGYKEVSDEIMRTMKSIVPNTLESPQEIFYRAQKSIEVIKDLRKEGNVAVVAHGSLFKYMLSYIDANFNIRHTKKLNNCEIHEFQ